MNCKSRALSKVFQKWLGDWGMTEDERLIIETYRKMCQAMISKDGVLLNKVLDDSFVLVHMTGMRQSKNAFIHTVLNGTLNYYSASHENVSADIAHDTASLLGQSNVTAAVFGGGRSQWRLQQKCRLKKTDGNWKFTESVVSTY